MQNTQRASLDSCKCPCICVFDCCFIQQFPLSTFPLTKLTRSSELNRLLIIIVTSCNIGGEYTLDKILLSLIISLEINSRKTNPEGTLSILWGHPCSGEAPSTKKKIQHSENSQDNIVCFGDDQSK